MTAIRKVIATILLFFWVMLVTGFLIEYWEPVRVMIYSGILFWISIGIGSILDAIENRGDDNEEEF